MGARNFDWDWMLFNVLLIFSEITSLIKSLQTVHF